MVEGIDRLEHLEELHIENQKLPPGEKLLIDPRSLYAISVSTPYNEIYIKKIESNCKGRYRL